METIMLNKAAGRPALARRGFLRGLSALPLIGGSVALIGEPTAAAVPVTDALQSRYLAWLAHEHLAAVREHAYRGQMASLRRHGIGDTPEAHAHAAKMAAYADYLGWVPDTPDLKAMVATAQPSTRAAVILSAAGVPLT